MGLGQNPGFKDVTFRGCIFTEIRIHRKKPSFKVSCLLNKGKWENYSRLSLKKEICTSKMLKKRDSGKCIKSTPDEKKTLGLRLHETPSEGKGCEEQGGKEKKNGGRSRAPKEKSSRPKKVILSHKLYLPGLEPAM